MKSALIAAAALAGSAQAGVHKMKLQKVSLEEQLVRCVCPRPPRHDACAPTCMLTATFLTGRRLD